MDFNYLIMFGFSAILADRRQVTPRLSHANFAALNYLLQSEIFVSDDQQLWAVHLIQDFDPILKIFQEVGHTISAGDPWINCIDVSKSDFLARDDLPLVILPVHQIPPPLIIPLQQVPLKTAAAVEEEIAFSRLSFEEKMNQFRFEGKEGAPKRPVQLLDSEIEFDRLSATLQPKLVVARVDISSEEKGRMNSKRRPSLKGLIANRNKGGTSKDVPRT